MKNKKRTAFTIVELVIVIAVIAILSAVLIPTFGAIIKDANVAADQTAASALTTELHVHLMGDSINTAAELEAAIAGAGFTESKLTPKSEGYGYHFWYNFEKGMIELKKFEEIYNPAGEAAKLEARPSGPMAVAELIVDGDDAESKNPRTVVDGYYLLDLGGEIARAIDDDDKAALQRIAENALNANQNLAKAILGDPDINIPDTPVTPDPDTPTTPDPDTPAKVDDFTIYSHINGDTDGDTGNTITVIPGDTLVLKATDFVDSNGVNLGNKEVVWTVPAGVTMTDGKVDFSSYTGATFEVTATTGSGEDAVSRKVTILIAKIDSIKLDKGNQSLNRAADDTSDLGLTIGISGYSYSFEMTEVQKEKLDHSVTFSSSNSSVVDVDSNGVVSFGGTFGEATITVTLNADSNVSIEITVTITEIPPETDVLEKTWTGDFLYRVGNGNKFNISHMFGIISGKESDAAQLNYTLNIYDASLTDDEGNRTLISTSSDLFRCTINTATDIDSTLSKDLQFAGNGVAIFELIAKYGETEGKKVEIALEVVDGKNVTEATSATSSNIVLLNGVSTAGLSVSNGHTLYGNGFKVTDTRTADQTKNTSGWIHITNGYVDNAQLLGQHYPEAVTSGTTNNYYRPSVSISGGGIYNSYVSGGRYGILIDSGNVDIVNTTVDGGALANIRIQGVGAAVLDNVTTIQKSGNTDQLFGLGIWVASSGISVTLENALNQYNWGTKTDASDIPSDYQSIVNTIFTDTDYAKFRFDNGGTKYVNTGILFFDENEALDGSNLTNLSADGKFVLNGVTYSSASESMMGKSAVLFSYDVTANGNPANATTYPSYTTAGQYIIKPTLNLNVTNDAATDSSDREYFYYDEDAEVIRVGFKSEGTTGYTIPAASFAPTATKFGTTIPVNVSVSGTGVTYSGGNITFTAAGEYTIKLTYVDGQNYNPDTSKYNVTYEHDVKVIVTAIAPNAKHADFTFYAPDGTSYTATTVVIDGKTYVMPNVSATEAGKVMSTTVNGVTVYAPYVDTIYKDNSSDFNYIYPLFKGVTITDYAEGKEGGTATTYNTSYDSSSQWGNNTSGAKFMAVSDIGTWNYSIGTEKMEFKNSSDYGGTYMLAGAKGSDITQRAFFGEFSYTDNAGAVYYYFVYYNMAAHSKPSACVTPDTLITLADGTQKQVQYLDGTEMLLVWNHVVGKFDIVPLAIVFDHSGLELNREVITLKFDTGDYIEMMGHHTFFDTTLCKYVTLSTDNVDEYIGHKFGILENNKLIESELISIEREIRYTKAYEITAYKTLACFTNNVLSSTPFVDYHLNAFDIDRETFAYDEIQMEKDIETYGLLAYEDVKDLISEEDFYGYNVQYYGVSVGKGYITMEEVYEKISMFKYFNHISK